jgi:NADPH:quinone reductase-like Zn-dependent oxidoreductase
MSELRPHDLLVRIQAISVNPVDVKVRTGAQPPENQARIPGYDAVGIIEATGPEVQLFKKGDAVFYAGTIDRPGTYVDLHAVDERIVGRKPETLDAAHAAALPLTSLSIGIAVRSAEGALRPAVLERCDPDYQRCRRGGFDTKTVTRLDRCRYADLANREGFVRC